MFDRLHALIVDDQDLMRSVTASQLRAMGFAKVLSAKHGADALKLMRAQRIDAVLSDWNMPIMNGVELLRAVRADSQLAHIPILMITSETERGRIQDVITSGVNGLLVKPYNAGLLRDRLERMLSPNARDASKTLVQRGRDTGPHGEDELLEFPTPRGALDGLAEAVPLPLAGYVLDAGCGLGHGLQALERAYPEVHLHGLENSWPLRWAAAVYARHAHVHHGDMWAHDWSRYDMVYLFQRPESMARAWDKASRGMKPGSWLASLEFPVPDVAPTLTWTCPDGRPLWLYRLPGGDA